jgi:MraZ protein
MFIGTYEHSMDAKGRTSLPARFREILTTRFDGRLILTTSIDSSGRCIDGFPYATFEATAARLHELSPFDPDAQLLRRFFAANAVECEIDKQGRVLIPPRLRDHAGLTKDLVWVGNHDRVEIWDQAAFEELQRRTREELPQIMPRIAGNGRPR